jgi:hypothetical protein
MQTISLAYSIVWRRVERIIAFGFMKRRGLKITVNYQNQKSSYNFRCRTPFQTVLQKYFQPNEQQKILISTTKTNHLLQLTEIPDVYCKMTWHKRE